MRLGRALSVAAVVGLALAHLAPGCASDTTPTQKAIEERLTCQCGCGLTVHTCNHLQCSFAVPVKNDIAESLAEGQSAEQILDRYVAEYGEKVLSSPVPEGFNLVAWIAPYVAVIAGAVVLLFTVRRWQRPATPGEPQQPVQPTASAHSDADRRRIERELEDLDT